MILKGELARYTQYDKISMYVYIIILIRTLAHHLLIYVLYVVRFAANTHSSVSHHRAAPSASYHSAAR